MSLKRHVKLVAAATVVVLAAVSGNLLMSAERPNVILIITDDQAYPPLARLGHPWIRTPHLDALHDSSTRFSRFLVCPTCSPTRSALMTGRHSMRNGVTHAILERERLTLDAVTLPQMLSKAGYKSGIFGKWHLGDEEPYQPHRRAAFYGMLENIDDNVGRLMKHLLERDLFRNTVVIFMSDNGMTGGGSGKPGTPLGHDSDGQEIMPYNAEMRGLKGSTDEGGVRVPFFVRWDGHWQADRDIDRIAGDIDVFPTIAAITGAELPGKQVEGRSLLPLLDDAQTSWTDRYLYTHVGRWATGKEPNDFQWKNFSVRNQRFRFVNNTELFDMDADPGQTKNVIEQYPGVVEEIRTAWDAWWKETRPMMVNESAEMSPTRPFHQLYETQLANGGIPVWKPRK